MTVRRVTSATTAFLLLATGIATAQPRPDPRFDNGRGPPPRVEEHREDARPGDRHEWRRGEQMRREDWDRSERIDYRRYRLRPPPRGYEWRQVDNRFILGAIATGVIADVILNRR